MGELEAEKAPEKVPEMAEEIEEDIDIEAEGAEQEIEDLLDGTAPVDQALQWWGILLIVLASLICVSVASLLTYKCYTNKAAVMDRMSEYKFKYTLVGKDSDRINYETFQTDLVEEEKSVPPAFAEHKVSI